MNIKELILIIEENKYQLSKEIEEFGDTYIDYLDDFEYTSGLIYSLDNEKELIIEYHKESSRILSVIFSNTIVTSFVLEGFNTDPVNYRDFSEYEGYIYINETKINKNIIQKCINIQKNPLKSKIKILKLEADILNYIENNLNKLFKDAGLKYILLSNEYPGTEDKTDDITIHYYREDKDNYFGKSYGLYIYINIITENVWIHLYNQSNTSGDKDIDLILDFLGDKNEYIFQTIEDAMIDTGLL